MSNSYVGSRKTMSDLLYQSAFMLHIEEMRLQAEQVKAVLDNVDSNKENCSEITQDIPYVDINDLGYDIIPPAENSETQLLGLNEIVSEGIEHYENYNRDIEMFEEINPMSEISLTNNTKMTSIVSGKRDCSVQTDQIVAELNTVEPPLKKMEIDIEELKKKLTDVQSMTSSEQHRLENTSEKFSNNVMAKNVHFMFKRFPRQKISRPLTV